MKLDRREKHRVRVAEKIEARDADRREADRRDCPRLPMKLRVRAIGSGGKLHVAHGNISVGGAYWQTASPLPGADLEVRFKLPAERKERSAIAQVVRIRREGESFGVHVRFTVIDVLAELALARYIDARTRLVPLAVMPDVTLADAL